MIESNKLQTEYIRLFQKSLSISETNSQLKEEEKKLDKQRRKLQIKPRFEFDHMMKKPDIINYYLSNHGETAKIITFENFQENSMVNSINELIDKEIYKNNTVYIQFSPKSGLSTMQCYVKVKLIYEDIDNNKYSQIIESSGDSMINITKPIEE